MRILVTLLAAALAGSAQEMPRASAADCNVRAKPYRARADGKTDDTAAFQRALDDAGARGGGIVFVPAGRYLIASHLRVPAGVTLQGVAQAPQLYSEQTPGSLLLAVEGDGDPEGTPFLTLAGPNATLAGVAVLYPRQVRENPPRAYPWTVRAAADNASLVNLLLVNPYQAVDFATGKVARHYVNGLYGQPLYRGIRVAHCYDIGRIRTVHFWPFWTQEKKIIDYTTTHAIGFLFQRTDWEVVDDIFVWGYHVGVELSASDDGGMNGQMSNINLDNVNIGLDVRETQPYAVHISNLNIANAGAGTDRIAVWGRGAKPAELTIRGASFWGSLNTALRWENPGSVILGDSRVIQWNREHWALELRAGNVILHDNSITARRNRTGRALRIESGIESALVHGNQFHGNEVDNQGGDSALVENNQP